MDNATKDDVDYEVTVLKEVVNSPAPKKKPDRWRESDDVLHIPASRNVIDLEQDEDIFEEVRIAGKEKQ